MENFQLSMDFMIGGYIVFAVVSLAYVASLILRWKNSMRDLEMFKDLAKKESVDKNN